MKVGIFIICLISALILVGVVHSSNTLNKPIQDRPALVLVATNWTQWGGTKITSDVWEGTRLWQTRTNLDSGEVEMRCQVVVSGGGYK